MSTLPFDYSRCSPQTPDSQCKQCLRWADLPGQTWGTRTPVMQGIPSQEPSQACPYIPNNNKEST